MKKLSIYVFLGLMFCNVGFADCKDDLEVYRKNLDSGYFVFFFANPTNKTIKISKIQFLNSDKTIIFKQDDVWEYKITINPYSKIRSMEIGRPDFMGELVKYHEFSCEYVNE